MAWLGIELKRGIAVLQIKVEEEYPSFPHFGEVPSEIGRDRCRPDPTADPEHVHQPSGARRMFAPGAGGDPRKCANDQITDQRFEEVLGYSGRPEVAVQYDIVAVPDHDDLGGE